MAALARGPYETFCVLTQALAALTPALKVNSQRNSIPVTVFIEK